MTVLYDKLPHPHDLSNPVLFQAVTELFSENLSLRACLHVLPQELVIAHKHSRKGKEVAMHPCNPSAWEAEGGEPGV